MKFIITLFILSSSFYAYSQKNIKVKIYYEKHKDGWTLYADNSEFCPVSFNFNYELDNIRLSENEKTKVVPANSKRFLITELDIINKRKASHFNYRYKVNRGNHLILNFDNNYGYTLPFAMDKAFKVSQGYNTTRSHEGIHAIDFSMPVGTPICAAKGGVVVESIESNTKRCKTVECAKYNNKIVVYHPDDNTFGAYLHLKFNGSLVEVGQQINKGDQIGYSGNTGYSTGPHLHFEVYQQEMQRKQTIPTKFRISGDGELEYLREKKKYKRLH